MTLPSEDGEMQEETQATEQEQTEVVQEAIEQSDAESPAPEEEEIVFTDPISEPEESVGPSDAEISEALTDFALEDSEAEAEMEMGVE